MVLNKVTELQITAIYRIFFKEPKKAEQIAGVDETLISRLPVILQVISCDYKLGSETFRKYANEATELYVKFYVWYKMPTSLHKILIHGANFMDTILLAIGNSVK